MDPGVLVEICKAKELGIPVIGYRTDTRAPFGDNQGYYFGMHFFPLFCCDHFIYSPNEGRNTVEDQILIIDRLVESIVRSFESVSVRKINDVKPEWLVENFIP